MTHHCWHHPLPPSGMYHGRTPKKRRIHDRGTFSISQQFRIVRVAQHVFAVHVEQTVPDEHTVALYQLVVLATFASFVFQHTWYRDVPDPRYQALRTIPSPAQLRECTSLLQTVTSALYDPSVVGPLERLPDSLADLLVFVGPRTLSPRCQTM